MLTIEADRARAGAVDAGPCRPARLQARWSRCTDGVASPAPGLRMRVPSSAMSVTKARRPALIERGFVQRRRWHRPPDVFECVQPHAPALDVVSTHPDTKVIRLTAATDSDNAAPRTQELLSTRSKDEAQRNHGVRICGQGQVLPVIAPPDQTPRASAAPGGSATCPRR